MKIQVLAKRWNMGIDSLRYRHGRMYAIPECLVGNGHLVDAFSANYHRTGGSEGSAEGGIVDWVNVDLVPNVVSGLARYWRRVSQHVPTCRPDVLWCGSDALHVIMGSRLGQQYGVPVVADLKDNFEAFGMTRLPFIRGLYRHALRCVDGVTCSSDPLFKKVHGEGVSNARVLENAVPEHFMVSQAKIQARQELGLPEAPVLVGTAGALTKSRGADVITEAFENLSSQNKEVVLVVAGHKDKVWQAPRLGKYIDLGVVPYEKVPTLFNALDIGIIPNLDSSFGAYCYPQKYNEMLACGLPVVAARVGVFASGERLSGVVGTFSPGDAGELERALKPLLRDPPARLANYRVPTWNDRAIELEEFLAEVVDRCRHQM